MFGSLRSKRFRGVREQRKHRKNTFLGLSLLPNPTETLPRQTKCSAIGAIKTSVTFNLVLCTSSCFGQRDVSSTRRVFIYRMYFSLVLQSLTVWLATSPSVKITRHHALQCFDHIYFYFIRHSHIQEEQALFYSWQFHVNMPDYFLLQPTHSLHLFPYNCYSTSWPWENLSFNLRPISLWPLPGYDVTCVGQSPWCIMGRGSLTASQRWI